MRKFWTKELQTNMANLTSTSPFLMSKNFSDTQHFSVDYNTLLSWELIPLAFSSSWWVSHILASPPPWGNPQSNKGFKFTASCKASLGLYGGKALKYTWPQQFFLATEGHVSVLFLYTCLKKSDPHGQRC